MKNLKVSHHLKPELKWNFDIFLESFVYWEVFEKCGSLRFSSLTPMFFAFFSVGYLLEATSYSARDSLSYKMAYI